MICVDAWNFPEKYFDHSLETILPFITNWPFNYFRFNVLRKSITILSFTLLT